MSQLLDYLGLVKAGGNYAHMNKTIQRLNIDISHWKGQGWSKDQRLKDWSHYSRIQYLKKPKGYWFGERDLNPRPIG